VGFEIHALQETTTLTSQRLGILCSPSEILHMSHLAFVPYTIVTRAGEGLTALKVVLPDDGLIVR
jgi:hypothetical protein